MGADCKSAGYAYAGSNPARPTTSIDKFGIQNVGWINPQFMIIQTLFARVAQW